MDGVLADTRDYHLRAYLDVGAEYGLELSPEEFRKLFGLENRAFIPRVISRPMTLSEIDLLAARKEARYREIIADNVRLLDGVPELIDWLSQRGMPLAVASSAPRANVQQILETSGLLPSFRTYLGSEDVERHKPHPDVYLKAASLLGVAPERAWVVEDSHHGIEAAVAAGCRCIGVATTHPREELTGAAIVYDTLAELVEDLHHLESHGIVIAG